MQAQPPPTDTASIIAALTHMIAHELDVRIDERDITPTIALLEGGLMLDSMILFELIALIEQRYGVTFPAENLDTANFANLTVLADHITQLAASETQPAATEEGSS